MKRQRTRSIACKSRDEFIKVSRDLDSQEDTEIKIRRRKMSEWLNDDSKPDLPKVENEDDELQASCGYKLENKGMSIEEEESQLYSIIHEINKLTNEITFPSDIPGSPKINSETSTVISDKDISYTEEKNYVDLSEKINSGSMLNESIPEGISIDYNFLKQNIIPYNELLKIIVLGDNQSGKTSFINRIISDEQPAFKYEHTLSLEILKTLITYKNRKLKIEFFDTNEKILNSNILNVYYEFSHGVIYVIDPRNLVKKKPKEYLESLINKITHIQKLSNNSIKIFLAVNETLYPTNIKEKEKKNVQNNLKNLQTKLKLEIFNFNLKDFNIYNPQFKDLICRLLGNKWFRASL